MNTKTIQQQLLEITQKLQQNIPDKKQAEQEAWWLLEKVTGLPKATMIIQGSLRLSKSQQKILNNCIDQRVLDKKPLQYILGTVPFCGLMIDVLPPLLIPRPETEEWVTWLINKLHELPPEPIKILDLCTGTGCIGLALAANLTHAQVSATDNNVTATSCAQNNQMKNHIKNITFYTSDLFSALPPQFTCDLIVSNPPYLSIQEYANISEDVKNWEDISALVAPDNGLAFYKQILEKAPIFLSNSVLKKYNFPTLVFEIGPAQNHIEKIIAQYQITSFQIFHDMQKHRRWVALQI